MRFSRWIRGLLAVSLIVVAIGPVSVAHAAPTTATYVVAASSDDAVETGDSTLATADMALDVGRNTGSTAIDSGMRWLNVDIPKGATITEAHFEVRAYSYGLGAGPKTVIKGLKTGSMATFSSTNRPSQVAKTSATTTWDLDLWTADTWYNSPNIASVIQEIIDQPEWVTGNPVALAWEDDGTPAWQGRLVYSYDWWEGTTYAPKLVVTYEYTSGPDTTAPTVSVTAPADGATVGGTYAVTASAADDRGVARVDFAIDGTVQGSDTTAPFGYSWDTKAYSNGAHFVTATAYDAAGNSAASSVSAYVYNDAVAPVISGVSSSAVTATSAAVTWTTDEQATTQVEYGTTTAYGSSTTENSSLVTAHTASLSGLTASTTYHYRVVSKDASGNRAVSGDYTLTTTASTDTTAPTISSVSAGYTRPTCSLIRWTTDEPATSRVEYGTTTSYGSTTSLDTTLVTSHEVVLSGLRSYTRYYYRVWSADAAGNERVSSRYSFTTARSDTTLPTISSVVATELAPTSAKITWTTNELTDAQVQYGLTTSFGSATPIDATLGLKHAVTLSGLQPGTRYYYRALSRDPSGNLRTGSTYNFTTSAAADTTPPTFSAVAVGNIGPNSATITWTTNEGATTQVEYGTTTSYGSTTGLDSALVTSHSAALSGLTADTTYHYRVISRDAAGNQAASGDYTFTTAASDTTPPTISSVTSSNLTQNSATITWTTNEGATTQVEYGLTGSYGLVTTLDSALVTSHSSALTGLAPGTTYHYRVVSKDAAGNQAVSGDYTFSTVAPDTTPPTISSVAASNIGLSAATITWATNEAASTQVEYGPTTSYGSTTNLDATLVTSHTAALSGLSSGTTYHYRVLSRDTAGNLATSGDYTFTTTLPDTTPPTISSVSATNVGVAGATIAWNTNEGSTSQVQYGTTTAYGSSTTLDTALVTSHSVTLGGLSQATLYHYRVLSRDAAGNLATSGDYTFTTTTPPAYQPGVAVSFSFDDGARNAYTAAYPILRSYGFPGTVYVITDNVGQNSEALSVSDLTTMQNSGWEISSHTADHTMTEATVSRAKTWLDANGFPNSGFASPGGVWSHSDVTMVKKYHPYFRVADGLANTTPYDQYRISVRILDGTSISQVRAWLDEAQAKKQWIVFLSHNVATNGGTSPDVLQAVCQEVAARNIPVYTPRTVVAATYPPDRTIYCTDSTMQQPVVTRWVENDLMSIPYSGWTNYWDQWLSIPAVFGFTGDKTLPTERFYRNVPNGTYDVIAGLTRSVAASYRYYYSFSSTNPQALYIDAPHRASYEEPMYGEYYLGTVTVTNGQFSLYTNRIDSTTAGTDWFGGWAWVKLMK
jgi:peptidoglycan/xylan/chitin deacetylase (PgdA/CDA1 family)